MLPIGAFAVAVFLGGVQILLPAPAFVEQGRTWAPARAILQRAGYTVRWQPAQQQMLLALPDRSLAIPTTGALPDLSTPHPPLCGRRVNGTVYLSLPALRQLGFGVSWDHTQRRVELQTAPGTASDAGLAPILADPPAWVGREVIVTGEYGGWGPDRFHFATALGPPVGSGDWVLHNDDGAIYCSPAPAPTAPASASLSPLGAGSQRFTPYARLGRRVVVQATVRLAANALPYLAYVSTSQPEGAAGIACRIVPDRQRYGQGETVSWTISLWNPGPGRWSLKGTEAVIALRGPQGDVSMLKHSLANLSTDGIVALAPGLEVTSEGVFAPSQVALPGRYSLTVRVDDEVTSYPAYLEMEAD